jgi:hypothetical protein
MLYVMAMLVGVKDLWPWDISAQWLHVRQSVGAETVCAYLGRVLDTLSLSLFLGRNNLLYVALVAATPRAGKDVVALLDGLAVPVFDVAWHFGSFLVGYTVGSRISRL